LKTRACKGLAVIAGIVRFVVTDMNT
jgi:hypothetical protein